ncbi:MAG TPA: protein translocase subunit SecD [Balneolaceae bacterium]|nr:protein translocase subunit SecD [Balneolaceae bacterium]|tara:strand:- start:101382 stop:103193 length:1812 start_codon:yes stop_codon:yes gene_type:complete
MQGNGFKIGVIVAFLALTLYYLYPTIIWNLEQKQMAELSDTELAEYKSENMEKLQSLRENILSLGLDLQGGMHVTLEVGTPQLIVELAGQNKDEQLEDVVRVARERADANETDFVDEMLAEFEARDPNARLSRYYRSEADDITRRSTNEEIVAYLKTQRDAALDRAIEIIRTRVDRFGVTEPSIVKQGESRIVVELPGVDDEERVRGLLKGTARLEFRTGPDAQDFANFRNRAIEFYNVEADTSDSLSLNAGPSNELVNLMSFVQYPYIFGYASAEDTAAVMDLVTAPDIVRMLPRNTELLWAAYPLRGQEGPDQFALYGVHTEAELTGEVIESASIQFDPTTNAPEVAMGMNNDGARTWSRVTGANIGKPIAIVLDDYVVSYPNVETKISGGNSTITGLDGVEEAEDLVNILMSGALPAPLQIIEERTVGATLGAESIQAGLQSVLFGLVVVAIFMIVYYRAGGAVADLALLLNIIFILGILAGFHATLTLPGMAGIVLTIGMAVDANVLIFDRIREEQRGGKTMRAAISSGYANAMSAIIDANVTTGFVAIILMSFGVGPIKGFAVTLLAGIVCSLFSAIVITRVVIDYLTRNNADAISFG